jgi:hypothetical protein
MGRGRPILHLGALVVARSPDRATASTECLYYEAERRRFLIPLQ